MPEITIDTLIDEFPFVEEVISTPEFQRLFSISFLGGLELSKGNAVDDFIYERPFYNRGDHSINVAIDTFRSLHNIDMQRKYKSMNILYALLHDIGHGPFSHSSEAVFSLIGVDHHSAFVDYVFSNGGNIPRLIGSFGIDLVEFYNFTKKSSGCNIFNRSINPDVCDGVHNSAKFFDIEADDQFDIAESLYNSISPEKCDEFWNLKKNVYIDHILDERYSVFDLYIDVVILSVFDNLSKGDFRLGDVEFVCKYRNAFYVEKASPFSSLNRGVKTAIASLADYRRRRTASRRIQISHNVDLTCLENINLRYTDTDIGGDKWRKPQGTQTSTKP